MFGLVQLFDLVDRHPPGSSVHGSFQARILEWVAISSSKVIFRTKELNLKLLHWQADSLPLSHLGNPWSIRVGKTLIFIMVVCFKLLSLFSVYIGKYRIKWTNQNSQIMGYFSIFSKYDSIPFKILITK